MTIDKIFLAPREIQTRPEFEDGYDTGAGLMLADATNYPAGYFPRGMVVCDATTGFYDPYINHAYVELDTCQALWDDNANGTCALDDETPCGTYSNKITIAAAASAGDIVADNDFTAANISASEFIMFWAKSSIALDASDIKVLTSDSASAASPATATGVPAMNANEWTYVVKAIGGSPHAATVSVGIEADVDKGAMDFWIADIRTADVQATAACGILKEDVWFNAKRNKDGNYNGTDGIEAQIFFGGSFLKSELIGYDSGVKTDLDATLVQNSTVLKF